jgi:hypothetical protein
MCAALCWLRACLFPPWLRLYALGHGTRLQVVDSTAAQSFGEGRPEIEQRSSPAADFAK